MKTNTTMDIYDLAIVKANPSEAAQLLRDTTAELTRMRDSLLAIEQRIDALNWKLSGHVDAGGGLDALEKWVDAITKDGAAKAQKGVSASPPRPFDPRAGSDTPVEAKNPATATLGGKEAIQAFLSHRTGDFIWWENGQIVTESFWAKRFRVLGGDLELLTDLFEDCGTFEEAAKRYLDKQP